MFYVRWGSLSRAASLTGSRDVTPFNRRLCIPQIISRAKTGDTGKDRAGTD